MESFATKSLSFSALSPSSIITFHQKRHKNCFGKPHCSEMESFATKSLSFSALSPSSIITFHQNRHKNCFGEPHCSAMERFATKSLSFSALSSSSIIIFHQNRHKNTLKSISHRNLVICASSGSSSVVTLLDYGAGNVRSVRNAIRHLGFEIEDVRTPKDILNAERLIFPGVGAFASAMDVLTKTGMAEALCTYIENDRPFLGICLGLQLLFESSEENGPVNGLGLIPGVVGRFCSLNGFRVPHIGWNALQIAKDSEILDDIGDHHVYFVHSYRAMPSDDNKEWVSSTCNYGDDFIASIRRGNVHAVQFHPEKSGDVGLSVLRRFLQPKAQGTKKPTQGKASKLAKRVIACLDVRTNDKGDLVVTKGDQYDVREHTKENEVRNLGKPVELAGQYYKDGADEVSFLNITGFRDFPLDDLPMLQVLRNASENVFVPLTVGGGIRDFTDANGRQYSSLEVASEYFRSGADKISIGSDAVYAAEEYIKTKVKTGKTSLEQISRVYGNQVSFLNITGFRDFPLGDLPVLQVLKHTSENVFGAFASAMNVLTKTGVSQEGKVVSIGRKMKEKIKGYVSGLVSFDKSRMHEFAEASNKKSITKQDENRGWFKVCLMVCLLLPNGLKCVRSEDTGNALIPGSTAMNSLLANKNLRGFEPSGRRQMAGFNYNNFPRGNSGTSNPPVKQANPYQRPCNAGEYCRQGKKGKN